MSYHSVDCHSGHPIELSLSIPLSELLLSGLPSVLLSVNYWKELLWKFVTSKTPSAKKPANRWTSEHQFRERSKTSEIKATILSNRLALQFTFNFGKPDQHSSCNFRITLSHFDKLRPSTNFGLQPPTNSTSIKTNSEPSRQDSNEPGQRNKCTGAKAPNSLISHFRRLFFGWFFSRACALSKVHRRTQASNRQIWGVQKLHFKFKVKRFKFNKKFNKFNSRVPTRCPSAAYAHQSGKEPSALRSSRRQSERLCVPSALSCRNSRGLNIGPLRRTSKTPFYEPLRTSSTILLDPRTRYMLVINAFKV